MRSQFARRAMNMVSAITVVVSLVSLFAVPLPAQQRTSGISERDRNIMDRERQLRAIEMDRRKGFDRREPRLALARINEDFSRIQALDQELRRAFTSDDTADYKSIAQAAAEIKKRAARLKNNLVLPDSGNGPKSTKGQNAPDDGQLKGLLATLATLIKSFVTNPVFTSDNVVDVQLSARAKRDLEGIIKVSDKVRENAEVAKNAGKPR